MSTKVTTPKFRVAFPKVFKAHRNDLSGKDEFSLVALFAKGEDLTSLKKAAQAAIEKKFGADRAKWPKNLKTPFRDQGDREKENENGEMVLPQGYEKGAIYLNLKSNQRPGLVGPDMGAIIDEADFYGGCYARASINAYAYDTKGNRGVAFGLVNIQKLEDGDHFGNRTRPEDDFSPVATGSAEESTSTTDDLFS